MGSKQVMDEGKLADSLIDAARTSAREIGVRRAAQYRAAGEEGPTPAKIEAQVLLDARMVEALRVKLKQADDALDDELGDDAAVLAARDASAARVRTTLVDFREAVATNCGDVAVTALGFAGETPRDPVALEQLGAAVLRKVGTAPPKATRKGVRFDAKAALEGFDDAVEALAKANADARREKREEQLARARREETWQAFDRELASMQKRLDADLRAVGLDDVADRLVASSRAARPEPEPAPPAPDDRPK